MSFSGSVSGPVSQHPDASVPEQDASVLTTVAHSGRELDQTRLLGHWHNTDDGSSGGIVWLTATAYDGGVRVRALGAGSGTGSGAVSSAGTDELYDWGEVEARTYANAPDVDAAWAFFATFDFGFLTTTISAYAKAGILVLTSYNAYAEPGARASYFTREFFHRDPVGPPDGAGRRPGADVTRAREQLAGAAGGMAAPVDLGPMTTTWINFDPAAKGIERAEITERDGRLLLRPVAPDAPEALSWDEAGAVAFADGIAETEAIGLVAAFPLPDRHVEMVGYINRRLLTLETGTTFVDGSGRSPFFIREHFYPSRGKR